MSLIALFRKSLSLFFFFFLLNYSSFSKELKFSKIDMSSGISNNSALCLLQDHHGFIWIGTRDGLNRYDGTNNAIYKHIFNDSASIANNQINCLFETAENEIWVGTSGGLNWYDSDFNRFSTFHLIKSNGVPNNGYIWTIEETADNKLWIGTTQGLFIIEKDRKSYQHYFIDSLATDNTNNILKIKQDSLGNVWIGTRQGLLMFRNEQFIPAFTDNFKRDELQNLTIRDIQLGPNELVWLATENKGVYAIRMQIDKPEIIISVNEQNKGLISNTVRKIRIENNENIWIGTLDGLALYNPSSDKLINYRNSPNNAETISNNSIRDIITDSDGGLWIATYSGGVNYYHPRKNIFEHYLNSKNADNKSLPSVISVLLEDSSGKIWVGTETGGLIFFDSKRDSVLRIYNTSNSKLSNNNIKSLAFGETGKLWIGTFNGLNYLDISSGKIINYYNRAGDSVSLAHNQVHALLFENENKLWVGTNGKGVQILNPKTNTFKNINGTNRDNVNVLSRDNSGRIWVGCQNRIFAIHSDDLNVIPPAQIMENPNNEISNVTFILEGSEDRIWIGTRGNGLFCIKNKNTYWYNTNNGLPDNTVNALLEGDDGSLWITTNKGLSKIRYRLEDESSGILSVTYSVDEGVQGFQFYPNSALKSATGELYFGGINGINKFAPGEISDNSRFPKLVLTELRLKYKPVNAGEPNSPLVKNITETDNLTLDFNQRDFTISFTGINFINPGKTNYRYRIEGLDKNWIELGTQPLINFTYFPVGNYKLQIQATTNTEIWGDNYLSLNLNVLPPWWRTWWAMIIYIFIMVMLLTIFFYYSQKWAKIKNQLAMEHFQREKENELHRLKLKFFTDISHELRTPLTMIIAPLERLVNQMDLSDKFRNQLTQIQRNSYKMMQLINQVLDLRKLETGHDRLLVAKGNIIRFLGEISLAFNELAKTKEIFFSFQPGHSGYVLWYDRNKLEIIINNLLSNAFKFTPKGGKVELSVNEVVNDEIPELHSAKIKAEKYICIAVSDNGTGIKPEKLGNIFERFYSDDEKKEGNQQANTGVGLELAKRLAELHKGFISVKSSYKTDLSPGFSQFRVYLPVGRNVFSPEDFDRSFKNSEDVSQYTQNHYLPDMIYSPEPEQADDFKNEGNGEKQRMLVVEDNAEVRKFIKDLFEKEFEIAQAENGKKGLDIALELCPDIVISDIMMPVMDGIELCRKLKTDPRTSHIPVILLTARTALTFQFQGIETGADDYITKPFNSNYLLLRVKNLIGQRKLMQDHFRRELIFEPSNYNVTSFDEKLLIKAVNYISENMADSNISVEKLSSELGLSRVHFYRKIKSLTNMTAVEFIRSVRLKRAAQLLQKNKLNVNEVRQMVGFEDADYFRECFKSQFGVNPSSYAENQLKN